MDDSEPEEIAISSGEEDGEEDGSPSVHKQEVQAIVPHRGFTVVHATEPVKELTIIELPADVRNEAKAYDMLGGLQGIASICQDRDVTMRFNICAPYKFAAPVEGQRKPSAKVVLKVCEDGTIEFVGVATVTYVFDLLADFHYLAPKSLEYGETSTPKGYQLGREMASLSAIPEILYCPPPYFTRKMLVENYDFEDNAYAPVQLDKDGNENAQYDINKPVPKKPRLPSSHVPCNIIRSFDAEVPTSPPEGLRGFEEKWEQNCLEHVRILFSQRPVWLRASLEAHLPPGTTVLSWMFNRVLQHVAYLWQDGPYRQCYIRLGFDPRKDPVNLMYQVIDFRDPDLREKRIRGNRTFRDNSKKTPEQRLADVQFTAPPVQQSQLYQLVDIQDVTIQELVSNYEAEGTFDLLQGFLAPDFFNKVRNAMKLKSAMMRSEVNKTSLALTLGGTLASGVSWGSSWART